MTVELASGAPILSASMPVNFADLRLGARVRVTAFSDGDIFRGALVDVLDVVGVPTQVQGVIAGLSRDQGAFQFLLGNRVIRGNSGTQTFEGDSPSSDASLQEGMAVDVDGLQRAEYIYASNVTVGESHASGGAPGSASPSPNPDPNPSPSPGQVAVGGVVGNISGSCPLLLFNLDGSPVVTNGSTQWNGGACATLKPGASANATGTQDGDTVVAREVTVNQ
jgi:hypothetical protein